MIPASEAGGPVRRWILRSMPLSVLIQDFLRIRALSWFEEEDFPDQAKEALESRDIIARSGGLFLGDRRNCRAGIVLRDEKQNLISIARVEEELFEYLIACGWRRDTFAIVRPSSLDLSFSKRNGMKPLFLLFWAQERPPLERMLGGRGRLPEPMLKAKKNAFADATGLSREKKQDITFTTETREDQSAEKSPVAESENGHLPVDSDTATEGHLPDFDQVPWNEHGRIRFRIAGNLRGPVFRKFFIKTSPEALKILAFASNRSLKPDYLEMMFDMLGNETDMVESYLEQIRLLPGSDVRACALHIDGRSGVLKAATSGLCPYLIRANGRAIRFADIRKSYKKRPAAARAIHAMLKEADVLTLMPADPPPMQRAELFSAPDFAVTADRHLDAMGLGRALLIRKDTAKSAFHELEPV